MKTVTLLQKTLFLLVCITLVAGCSSVFDQPIASPPQVATRTKSGDLLESLPPAKNKIVVAVYNFEDQTGQMKQVDTFADYSHAVTQGGLAILTKALLDTSHKKWFTVIERGDLKNLLQERQIIKVTRGEYQSPGNPLPNIKPMLYAGIIIEGGIISYESNITTGGAGAKYLGVGGSTQYRRDIVTVYLRAVSSQTGEILLSVNTSKTIYSTSVTASAFRYVSLDKLLEIETGFTFNEPPQFAVRQAIEMGVYALIVEGAMDKLWEFKDPAAGQNAINDYMKRRDGDFSSVQDQGTNVAKSSQLSGNAIKNSVVSDTSTKEQDANVEQSKSPAASAAKKAIMVTPAAQTESSSDDALPFYNYGKASNLIEPEIKPYNRKPLTNTLPDTNKLNDTLNLKKPEDKEKLMPDSRYSKPKNTVIKPTENCVNGECDAGTNP